MGGWSRIAAWLEACAAALARTLGRPSKSDRQTAEYESARRDFHQQRERLEARFFHLASGSGKPRGLRWTECDFDNDVTYARDRQSGELCAFVAVTIAFEAVEGGLMEGVEAVGNLRAASAVFRFQDGRWQTDGRALFNLSPSEAIRHFHDNLVMIGHEPARTS